jgi:hypothetical protein
MHLLHMRFDNARVGGRGELGISRSGDEIAEWTILDERRRASTAGAGAGDWV